MDFEIGLVIAGLTVGFIVGLTGVGGGSLMTPILLWFNIPRPRLLAPICCMPLLPKQEAFMPTIKKATSIGSLRVGYPWAASRQRFSLYGFFIASKRMLRL